MAASVRPALTLLILFQHRAEGAKRPPPATTRVKSPGQSVPHALRDPRTPVLADNGRLQEGGVAGGIGAASCVAGLHKA